MTTQARQRPATGSKPLLGCVADDYTGATDLASGLKRVGLQTVLHFGSPTSDRLERECDALVVALKSRHVQADAAVGASLAAERWLHGHRAERIYFKYCSTFDSSDRGNIGAVADALRVATRSSIAVVCPASPEHGRTVYQGHLFVGDQLLAESSMRDHPLTPMRDSNLVRVLSRQTPHPVGLVALDTVRDGPEAAAEAISSLAHRGYRFAVIDAVCDQDLEVIGQAADSSALLTGAAGLARGFATTHRFRGEGQGAKPVLPEGPALILAGSCSAATLEQVDACREKFPSFQLRLGGEQDVADVRAAALDWVGSRIEQGPLLVYSSAPADRRASGRAAATEIERTMGALARLGVERGARRLVVAGGETSGAVVDALGISCVEVAGEIERGVPWIVTEADPKLALVLKSGNFGSRDLLCRAATD